MNAITTTQDTKAVALYSGSSLVPRNMDEAIRLAEFMCRARTLPEHLWDSPGDCLMVVELAMRWGMSPFAVAQATSVISGKQMIEGKLVAAACESVGAIVGQFDYSFAGEGDDRSITVTATRRGETNPRMVTVKLADAKTANQMWVKQPDQQLVYHGVRVWARRWTPAVILGVYSKEEWGQVIEGEVVTEEPADEREKLNRDVPLKAAAAPMPRGARVAERAPAYEAPRRRSAEGEDADRWEAAEKEAAARAKAQPERTDAQWRTWLDKLRAATEVLYRKEEVVELGNRASVGDAIAGGPQWVRAEVSAILAENYARFPDEPTDDLPEVEIEGERNVMAGDD